MNQLKENAEEATAVKAFRVKMAMARFNVTKKSPLSEAQMRDSSGYLAGEFDISGLPLPVKKHIITAGIIQGDIFQYGDGFAYVKEVNPSQTKSSSDKTLHLQVQALTPRSYEMAIRIIETLIDEVWEPQKKTLKRLTGYRSWGNVLKNEYEIQNLMKPVLSHLITQGIIKGEIYQYCGAVVNAKGSPYLTDDSPEDAASERPIYLLIQGPDDKTLYWAIEKIKSLIKEAEDIFNNDMPEVIFDKRAQPSEDPVSHDLEPKELQSIHQHPRHLPFMPQLGQTAEADVKRCTVLVQWLLAHPLLVSFMACPPKGCESKQISKKMATFALLCLPLYDQYECSHSTPNEICANCHKFFSDAQKAVEQCCESVVSFGYDISKLISVDDYIKNPAVDPAEIGVLYDYPLPLNLFYIDNCRLFIDLAINYGLEIDESNIKSYLRLTNQWYPVESFQKILAGSKVYPCPSKNPPTHQYPLYCSIDHHGGLINFHLTTIGNASPERLFPPDAPKIPRCEYFPFLKKLSVFSKLYNFNKHISAPEKQSDELSGSISFAAYQMTKELLNNCEPSRLSPHGSLEGSARQQQLHPGATSGSSVAPPPGPQPSKPLARISRYSVVPPFAPEPYTLPSTLSSQPSLNNPSWNNQILQSSFGNSPSEGSKHHLQASTSQNMFPNSQNLPKSSKPQQNNKPKNEEQPQESQKLPPSFSIMRDPYRKPTASPIPKSDSSPKPAQVNPSRKLRKQRRKEEAERKIEQKREDINKTIETLKEKHGTDSFWTSDPSTLNAENAKEKLTNLLDAQPNVYNLQFGSTQPQTPAMSLLTGTMFPQSLQQALGNMQMSMPATQPTLFGAQPLMMGHENKSILQPPLLSAEQMFKGQQPGQDDSQLIQDGSKANPLSDVISKLQEYIQATGTKADGVESEGSPAALVDEGTSGRLQQSSDALLLSKSSVSTMQQDTSSTDQATASGDSTQDSSYAAIIQQLQQFIDSNSQITSRDDFARKTPPANHLKKPLEPIASKMTNRTEQDYLVGPDHKQESSQWNRASTEGNSESTKSKRSYIQFSNTKPSTSSTSFSHHSESSVQKPRGEEEYASERLYSSQQQNFGKQPGMVSAFTDSNSQITSRDDFARKTPPANHLKKPLEPIASKMTNRTEQDYLVGPDHKQESSQWNRASTEGNSESTKPKRSYIQFSNTKPSTPSTSFSHHSESSAQKPHWKEEYALERPYSSEQPNFGKQSGMVSAFIDLTSWTTSQDHLQKATPPADLFKKPFGPIGSKKTKGMQETSKVGLKRKQESSQLEGPSESTKPKRSYIEFSNTKPTSPSTSFTHHLESPVQRPGSGKEASVSQKPSSSLQTNVGKQPKAISEVSILGDSLLQSARAQFGGSENQDRRKDDFTIADLKNDVIQFHNKGGQLAPYCILMCGVNDIIKSTPPKSFVQELKSLLNYLLVKGHYVLLVSLPLVISNVPKVNKAIPEINGLISSFNTKPNLTIIPFHKLFQKHDNPRNLLRSIHIVQVSTVCHTVVLSNLACKLIQELIEKEVLVYT